MVDQTNIDVVISTIAVLTPPPAQPKSIDQRDLQRVLARPLSIGQTPDGIIVSSQRDQIEVIAGGNKINVRDLSGRKTFSESRIPPVLHFFLDTPQITSYGVNFVIAVPCAEAPQWIRDNILSTQISEKTGKTVIGGAGVLKIAFGNKTWNIKLEPREDAYMNVDFNASEETQQLPENGRLREELQEQYDALVGFLNELGL